MSVAREERVVGTFVELAETIVGEFDAIEFLSLVAERCVELLDCSEAGLLVADADGVLRVMASTNEAAEALELLQAQADEGACLECLAAAAPVRSEDLTVDRDRWPSFAPAALSRGFRSVQALPMRVRGDTVGALNLFRSEPGMIADHDLPLGQGLADIAAVALTQARATDESRGVVEQLQGALSSRVVIEQAKGILAGRAQIGVDVAFMRLRAHARAHNLRLADVARDLVRGKLDPSEL